MSNLQEQLQEANETNTELQRLVGEMREKLE